ncbi:hypothetical protein C3L33_13062, partial [Rhododendron williamsianum]
MCFNVGILVLSIMASVNDVLSKTTPIFHLKVWVLIGILVGMSIVVILLVLSICLTSRKKSRRVNDTLPVSQIPTVSKEIKEIRVDRNSAPNGDFLTLQDKFNDDVSDEHLTRPSLDKTKNADNSGQSDSFNHLEKVDDGSQSGEKGSIFESAEHPVSAASPLSGMPEFSHLGWGHWFTLRDLEVATERFSKENVIGEGGYGVVYRGYMVNGTAVAVKKLLNNLGQAEKEFRVEVEAIGHVRHKNLVRLLGYCIEGTHRAMASWSYAPYGYLTWEARMKVLLGTAKALAYLHEAIEPKVVHRDIKSSNILIDDNFNAKISDFGLAKLLGAGKSYITTRVNLVDWLKMMVGSRRSEEVVDPTIETRPSTSALKRALLTALRCVDPDSNKRPKMSQVVRMLESEEYPIPREDRRRPRKHGGNTEGEIHMETSDTDKSDIPVLKSEIRSNHKA